MKFIILIMIALFLNGCINTKTISLKYYPDCEENYDLYGVHYINCRDKVYNSKHKSCLNCN